MEQSKNLKRLWKDRQHGGRIYPSRSKPTKRPDTESNWNGEDIEPTYKRKGGKNV